VAKYYCHSCSAALGYLQNIQAASVLLSKYQLGKYIKHTVANPKYNVQSVFASASTSAYEAYVVSSAAAGSVEVDGQNRVNIIWVAGHTVGFKYQNGKLICPEDSVKVVLSTSTGEIHAYSQSRTQFHTARCANCGNKAVY
jgi:hypothetical protein